MKTIRTAADLAAYIAKQEDPLITVTVYGTRSGSILAQHGTVTEVCNDGTFEVFHVDDEGDMEDTFDFAFHYVIVED